MKLSASIIVRNESTEIIGCLDSLLGVDEIVVVDTGSEDDTRELVREWAGDHLGTSVILGEFDWVDNFAAARNYAASLCTGDWILTISADGRMAPGSVDAIRTALPHVEVPLVRIWQESIKGWHRHRRGLVHRPALKWVGAVHENLSIAAGFEDVDATMIFGWSESHKKDPDRNIRILKREWKAAPTPRTAYYLGAEYWDRQDHDAALPWFHRCVETTRWPAERADAHLYIAKILWQKSRGDEARHHCLASLANVPECREALMLMAKMAWPQQAETWKKFAGLADNTGCIFVRSPDI